MPTIHTKFEVGQTVWFMNQNRAASAEVTRIQVHVSPRIGPGATATTISYTVKSTAIEGTPWFMAEHELFATKADLVASL